MQSGQGSPGFFINRNGREIQLEGGLNHTSLTEI